MSQGQNASEASNRRKEQGPMTTHIILAIIISYLEAIYTRLNHLVRRVVSPAAHRLEKRGDVCPLCGHQLGPSDQRQVRVELAPDGEVKHLPADVLAWRRCGGCTLHQVGAMP